jgi:hypothetical protein
MDKHLSELLQNLQDHQKVEDCHSNSHLDTLKRRTDAYFKVFDDLSANMDPAYKSLLSKLKKGLKDGFKEMESVAD